MNPLLPLLALCVWLAAFVPADAQVKPEDWSWNRKFKEGDACKCYFLNDWYDGTVQAVKGTNVQVAFQFAGATKVDVYDRGNLRFPWEADALTPPRQWTDSTGKFKIRASLMAVDAKTKEARLHKIDDGEDVSIPMDKLCEADRTFIGKVLGSTALNESALPEIEVFATGGKVVPSIGDGIPDHLGQMQRDPESFSVQLPMAGIPFAKNDFHEHINRIVPIGGSQGWVATSTLNHLNRAPGRLHWCSLTDAKIAKTHLLPAGHRALSIDPASTQLLTASSDVDNRFKASILTLWQGSPSAESLEPMMRWRSESENFAQNSWAEMIDANHVLHRWGRSSYVMWNTESKFAEFTIEQDSFFVSDPKLSPGRRYLVLPEDTGIRVIDLKNGEVVALMPMKQRVSAVCFDPTGEHLFAMTIDELWIWSVGSAEPPLKMVAQSLGSPFGCNLEWISDRRILINDSVLYDIELEQPLWNYVVNANGMEMTERRDAMIRVVDSKICYTAEALESGNWLLVIGAVDLPGPGVDEQVALVDFEKLFVTQTGTPVNLVVECREFNDEVKNLLSDRLVNSVGWQLATNAEMTFRARMFEGSPETADYVTSDGEQQTATARRFVSSVELIRGNKVIWSSATTVGGLPPIVFLRENQTVQGQVDRFRMWDREFFKNVAIPTRIRDPQYKYGFGMSRIGLRGITMTRNLVNPSIQKDSAGESTGEVIR